MKNDRIRQPFRSESLNLQKKKHTLQLPRFYSKPKQIDKQLQFDPLIKNHLFKNSYEQITKNQKPIINLNNRQQNISNKKQTKQYQSPKKLSSMKKIPLNNQKAISIIKYVNNQQAHKKLLAKQFLTEEKTRSQQKQSNNALKYVKFEINQPDGQKNFRSKFISSKITGLTLTSSKKSPLSQRQRKTEGNQERSISENKQIKTDTQGNLSGKGNKIRMLKSQVESKYKENEYIQREDLQTWNKITALLANMSKSSSDLKSAEEYITNDRLKSEKKFYMNLVHQKHKNKLKSHLLMTRISIYLYVQLIIHNLDVKNVVNLLDKLHQSHIFASNALVSQNQKVRNKSPPKVSEFNRNNFEGWMDFVSRNNQNIQKTLTVILSKRKIPQNDLFKNMLESGVKMQSIDFLDVIEKTLKWQILKMPSYPYLPPSQKQHHLVLDLDQTLIHYDAKTETFHVRPYAQQFIVKAARHFQISVFTAATKEYADQIIDQIDQGHNISHRLYRNHLTFLQQTAIKDLSMLGRPDAKTLIVDNIAANYRLQPNNGILIKSWYGQDEDQILAKLYPLLVKIVENHKHDLREGLKQYKEYITQEIAVEHLIYEIKCQL